MTRNFDEYTNEQLWAAVRTLRNSERTLNNLNAGLPKSTFRDHVRSFVVDFDFEIDHLLGELESRSKDVQQAIREGNLTRLDVVA